MNGPAITDLPYFLSPEQYARAYVGHVADVAPHVAACRAAGGPVLEIGCGTGRLLIPALEAGVACDGLDADAAMLDELRARLAARSLSAALHHADMREFALARRYARVTIPLNAFLHNLTQEDQLRTLRACRGHLAPGGSLQLTTFQPALASLLDDGAEERLVKEVAEPARGGVLRVWGRVTTDRVEQVRRVRWRLEEVGADGGARSTTVPEFRIRYVWKPEMELLLRLAGFARWNARPLEGAEDAPPREGDVLQWTAWPEGA